MVQDTAVMSDAPKSKRQKIDVACDSCRLRKVKCCGTRPVCTTCMRRNAQCNYTDDGILRQRTPSHSYLPTNTIPNPGPASATNETVFDAPARDNGHYPSPSVTRAKPSILAQAATSPGGIRSGTSQDRHDFYQSTIVSTNFNRSTGEAPGVEDVYATSGSYRPGGMHSPGGGRMPTVDSINSMTGPIESASPSFFGNSCASSFMQQLKSAVNSQVQVPRTHEQPVQTHSARTSLHRPAGGATRVRLDYTLPARRAADNLMKTYWELIHPLYPFFDDNSMHKAYTAVWLGDSPDPEDPILIATLNAIFASACQLAESVDCAERAASAATFFARAQDLLHDSLWAVGSMQIVQCLLIMGQYLQSTSSAHQCWMVIGHAIRVAQGLGLHLPQSNAYENHSAQDSELTRRVWHGCILMDRILSMTFGRPAMISSVVARAVPLPHLDSPEGNASPLTFYVKTLQLYEIISETLSSTLYAVPGAEKTAHGDAGTNNIESSEIVTVLKMDHDLMVCGRSLPSYLRISSLDSFTSPIYQRQAVVFRARFLHARILILRPILSRFCLPQSRPLYAGTILDESVGERMSFQCSALCLTAAHDLIGHIKTHFRPSGKIGMLPAWWYCIFYIYTASTILLTSRLRPVLEQSSPIYSITDSWSSAIEMLKALCCHGELAERCVAALEILSATISAATVSSTDEQASGGVAEGVQDGIANGLGHGQEGFPNVVFDFEDMSWLNNIP
ncbi:putative C6 transcription factor [Cadophora sp. MPI-SDFR-AT-0126]|nr:putative C6 transcription factor [Leotiomycetes sp. MPI-SDFR-AT-0126]